jgi:hypothetical protein
MLQLAIGRIPWLRSFLLSLLGVLPSFLGILLSFFLPFDVVT